jgi:hypothetical protein
MALFAIGCDDDRPATWEYVYPAVIQPNCATSSCHAHLSGQAGVKLHNSEAAYLILTGHPCDGDAPQGEAPRNFVVPGDPSRSRLMYLLLAQEVRIMMPPDRPLPAPDIDLIEQWILEGALCN